MADNFLQDKTFLLKVNHHRIRINWAAISVLDFETENIITRLEGKITGGNMTIAANSPTRRTGSLSVVFDKDTFDITNINNLLAIDKKIAISIGINNPYYNTEEYRKYGEILWFKQGVFFITQMSSQMSATSGSLSLNFIDKAGQLNGVCGGTLPASTSFHEKIIIDENDNQSTLYPLIEEIIRESVNHFGGENISKISIEDVDRYGRQIVKWKGDEPIAFAGTHAQRSAHGSFIIGNANNPDFQDIYYKDDIIGYLETDLTYPGELIKPAGTTVSQVLDEIVNTLGNYEYYYDVEGIFHFRKKHNYLATGNTPLNLQKFDDINYNDYYMPVYSDNIYLNEFTNTELISSINFSPNYSNIKNDFIVWGSKDKNGIASMVRYHLAIDERPKDSPDALCHKDIWSVKDKQGAIIRYAFKTQVLNPGEQWGDNVAPKLDNIFSYLSSDYYFNWREELYRRALLAQGNSTHGSYYDEELLAEWRLIFDPTSTNGAQSFKSLWNQFFGDNTWYGYTKDAINDPNKLRYWLDIIDTNTTLGQFSVNRIGRRTIVKEDSTINEVFAKEINDIVIIENTGDEIMNEEKRIYYSTIGQTYCFFSPDMMNRLSTTNSNATCYDKIRELLYNNLIYNSTISLTIIPIFYLDVNEMIHLNIPEMNIQGNYVINNISWSLGSNATMQLSLSEAITIA